MLELLRKMPEQGNKRGRKAYTGERVDPKPQPTILGNDARLFNLLMAKKGTQRSPLAAWIIGRWLEENKELLWDTFGIEYSEDKSRGRVVRHPSAEPSKSGL